MIQGVWLSQIPFHLQNAFDIIPFLIAITALSSSLHCLSSYHHNHLDHHERTGLLLSGRISCQNSKRFPLSDKFPQNPAATLKHCLLHLIVEAIVMLQDGCCDPVFRLRWHHRSSSLAILCRAIFSHLVPCTTGTFITHQQLLIYIASQFGSFLIKWLNLKMIKSIVRGIKSVNIVEQSACKMTW